MKHSKRFWSDLFYVPKYEKVSDKAFLRMMLSSVFGILLCGICLAGLTWAWFTSSISSTANTITAADFSVKISINGSEALSDSGIYNLSGNSTVTVKAVGSATTGYCKVEFGGKAYYTVPLFTNSESNKVVFTVYASEGSTLTITHQWGTCAVAATAENPRIGNQEDAKNHIVNSIGTPPEHMTTAEASEQSEEGETAYALTDNEQSYTVQQGDTMSEIANRYGTTADLISAYNNIESTAEIKAGDTLKIPPASYKITEPVTAQSETAESTASEPPITEEPATDTTGSINVAP